jgi:hypothetical protein
VQHEPPAEEVAEYKLDHLELIDYLENKGQWATTLLTDYKVNIEHVLTGVSENTAPAAGGKGAKAPAQK